jgi:hypothetical protein
MRKPLLSILSRTRTNQTRNSFFSILWFYSNTKQNAFVSLCVCVRLCVCVCVCVCARALYRKDVAVSHDCVGIIFECHLFEIMSFINRNQEDHECRAIRLVK